MFALCTRYLQVKCQDFCDAGSPGDEIIGGTLDQNTYCPQGNQNPGLSMRIISQEISGKF